MNCPGVSRNLVSPFGVGRDLSTLEAYAQAVRAYQDIVLELQYTIPSNPELLGSVLKKAKAAKETVNRYRSSNDGN